METKLYNQEGGEIGNVQLPDSVFGVKMNHDLVSQVVSVHRNNARSAIAHTKGRGDVRGGGKKPWRQKGTGRARHASIRSPIWKGGGVSFGPKKEQNFSRSIPKTMARKALFMALSSKFKDGELTVVDAIAFENAKTKLAAAMIKALKLRGSLLLVTTKKDKDTERAMRNIQRTAVFSAANLNAYDILAKKNLIIVKDSIPMIESTFVS